MDTRFSKKILSRMLGFLAVFTAAVLAVFWHTSNEPSTLVVAVFGFCGVEGGLLAWIRVVKEKEVKYGGPDSRACDVVDTPSGASGGGTADTVHKEQDY